MPDVARNVRPYYTIECKVDDFDLSGNLQRIRIASSVTSPYQAVLLIFTADNKTFILEDIYGTKNIVLSIQLLMEDMSPAETLDLELLPIKSELNLGVKISTGEDHPAMDTISLLCIPKDPFVGMNTTVNKLFDETQRKTPIQMIEDLFDSFISNGDKQIDTRNQNSEQIEQCIVYPMTFVNSIRYLDEMFGLYNGPAFYHWRFDDNKFCLWDLSQVIKSQEIEYTVYQLGQDKVDDKVFTEVGPTDDKFYTMSPIRTVYKGNIDIVKQEGYDVTFVSKPIDSLFKTFSYTLDEIFSSNTVIDKNQSLPVNDAIRIRKEYRGIGETGYEESEAIWKSRLSRKISSMSQVQFILSRNLHLTKLTHVGVPIMLETQVMEYLDYHGLYIVSSSDINIFRDASTVWMCNATIRAFRGNLKI